MVITIASFITFAPNLLIRHQSANSRFTRPRRRAEAFVSMSATSRIAIPTRAATDTPVLICDVLDTLVEDPFTHGMHSYFGYATLRDFIAAKQPNTWVQFELGEIDESELARTFFLESSSRKRSIEIENFKHYLTETYRLVPGVDSLLLAFSERQIPVHLCSNYPPWYTLIEDTCRLESLGARWTFVSALQGVRKPNPESYHLTARLADVPPGRCVLLDDRESNCVGARDAGYRGAVKFVDTAQARRDLAPFFGDWLLADS